MTPDGPITLIFIFTPKTGQYSNLGFSNQLIGKEGNGFINKVTCALNCTELKGVFRLKGGSNLGSLVYQVALLLTDLVNKIH